MNNWSALFDRSVSLLATEPVPVRIFVYLALAFFATMILEGMRLNFLPRRRLIRHLQLHAPNEDPRDALERASQSYAAADSSESGDASEHSADAHRIKDRVFRSAGSLKPSVHRAPSDLLATARDDAEMP
jgi:hypothetical protein